MLPMRAAKSLITRLPSPVREPVSRLGDLVSGTILPRCVERLYAEFDQAGMTRFRPRFEPSLTWIVGCLGGTMYIELPVFWFHPEWARVAKEIGRGDGRVFDDESLLALMRHEAGHAFNYAYRLYDEDAFRALFVKGHRLERDIARKGFLESYPTGPAYGLFDAPLHPDYAHYLERHGLCEIRGYAQLHPDEDFAESFATRLDPSEDVARSYPVEWSRGKLPKKLAYVADVFSRGAQDPPPLPGPDEETAIASWIAQHHPERHVIDVLAPELGLAV
jgi:hypothetical protein